MKSTEFSDWLQHKVSSDKIKSDILSRVARVEEHYPNLDKRFEDDKLKNLLEVLRVDVSGEPMHQIPIDSIEPKKSTSSLKSALKKYQQFCEEQAD